MNGNGTTDIAITQVQSAVGEKILVVDLVPAGKNFLLSRIENGLGLRVDLEYESSTAQMVRATAAGTPWSTVMPIAVTVVSRIAEDDGRGHVFAQTVTYRDPFYEPDKQEFRGFRSAEAAEAGDASIDGKLARMVFDTGFEAACLKGKLLGEEVLGEDGRLYQRSVHSWGQRALAAGLDGREVCFAFQAATDQFIHEGQPVGIHLRKETDYDDFGNAVGERNHGVFEVAGDELFIERTFEVRPAAWLLRLVKTATQRDGAGNLLDDREFFHDATGNLERIEAWLDTEDRWFPVLRQRLDAFGNVTEATDARGLRRTIGFDALLHALPVSETLHLESRELAMSAEYDLGFGVVTGAVDFHGQTTSYLYDALGRLVEIRRPGGAGELFEYTFGNPVSRVAKRLRLEGGATFDSFLYSDGLGRPLGSWLAAEDGRWRVVEAKSYNARKLEAHLWLPYTAESPDYSEPDPALPHEARSYDALGRLTEGLRPDGSIVRQERQPLGVAVSDGNDTAGGGTPDLRRYDGLERLRSVEEHNGAETYLTTYSYRATGELEAIVDALGNTRRFRFDSLGRLIEMDDPDRGVRRQVHDDVGNLVEREDARGQVTRWRYDAANRILERDYVGLTIGGTDPKDAVYHYDAPVGLLDFGDGTQGSARNVLGRLAWVEDATGEEHISYDERGNVEWVLKRVRDPRTGVLVPYRTQESHDLLNRETETIFPDNDRLRVERNAGGFVERLDGGPQGLVVLAGADYAPNGQPLRLRFGNAAESVFTYDRSQRLASLRALDAAGAALLDDAITYDLAANVTAIVDQRPLAAVPAGSPRRRSASFDYDELNRLTRVSYGAAGELGRIDYTYDALGNLLAQSTPPAGAPGHIVDPAVDLGDLSYAGGRSGRDGRGAADPPGPHAVTGTERGHRFAYDASGNVTAYAGASLNWDFEDRLSRFAKPGLEADYLHDHSQRRVSKLLVRNQAPEETLYLDQAFEVENGAPIKYALLDGRRLARITGVLDPTRERVQRLVLATGWNLIAAAVASPARLRDVFGADAAVYEARGASYGALDTSTVVPVARALWVHVPAARLAALRGPVPASAGGDSPGPLHAWPRLEGFAPALHVAGGAPLLVYEARERRWLRRDPSLPSFLSRAPADLGAARAFWSNGAVSLNPSAAAATAAVTYHQDHLGTPAALTDATGMLLEERAQYPYGALRSRHRPVGAEAIAAGAGGRWDFTGKERDAESDLVDMGARAYLDLAGIFLSPDPRYAEVALLGSGGSRDEASFTAFLHNPQMGNLYAYGTRNPLKYVDPSGLEVVFSPALQKNPVFQEALALFKSTKEGQRLLKHLSESKAVIRVNEGRAISGGKENLGSATREYNGRLEINVDRHKKFFTDKERLIFELADTIHHELRHAEGNVNTRELAQARGILDAAMGAAKQMKLPQGTIPPILRQGTEVHDALDKTKDDPLNREFRRQAQNQQVKQFLLNHPDPKYRAAGADMVTD
jgi:RHS repeat-associated protein